MQVASMGADTLSYKDFDPAFVESELAARIAVIEKDNEEAKRLGKTLKNVPKYISFSQLTEEVLKQAEEDAKAELKKVNQNKSGIKLFRKSTTFHF
jgi:elongation factor Ts